MTTPDGVHAAQPDGVLRVDKPAGPTSHDAVAAVRRALRTRRVGHTGTLDPFASGLLLICAGSATRAAEYLSGLDKRYTATVRLGVATDTDDLTGAVTAVQDAGSVTAEAVERALAPLRGAVLQRPPAYSAKKRAGERAYAAARAGRPLDLEPVAVLIHELRIRSFDGPDVRLDIRCGSGTYIRAIARDLGEALGTGGHLTELRRTAVGSHSVEDAVPLEALDDAGRVAAAMMSTATALRHLPQVELDAAQCATVRHGRPLLLEEQEDPSGPSGDPAAAAGEVVVLTSGGAVVAIGARTGARVQPRKVFA
jgi:tRNA pseudouridine55 synthase